MRADVVHRGERPVRAPQPPGLLLGRAGSERASAVGVVEARLLASSQELEEAGDRHTTSRHILGWLPELGCSDERLLSLQSSYSVPPVELGRGGLM
jgi:hypothetical protein